MKCKICKEKVDIQKDANGNVVWRGGHNARPVANGRCCSKCNDDIVIPVRLIFVQAERLVEDVKKNYK